MAASVAGNRSDDKSQTQSYQFHVKQLEGLEKPIVDQMARMSRLKETLFQATPQSDSLVAPNFSPSWPVVKVPVYA
jgi:hypothetical protein